jgi:hypothetical protein
MRMPDWLEPWVPPELAAALTSIVLAATPAIETVLGWAPALAGGLSVVVWVVWAIGSIVLIVLGVVLIGMVAVLRRSAFGKASPSMAAEIRG